VLKGNIHLVLYNDQDLKNNLRKYVEHDVLGKFQIENHIVGKFLHRNAEVNYMWQHKMHSDGVFFVLHFH